MSEDLNHLPVEQASHKPRSGCLIVFKILLLIVLTLLAALLAICSGGRMQGSDGMVMAILIGLIGLLVISFSNR